MFLCESECCRALEGYRNQVLEGHTYVVLQVRCSFSRRVQNTCQAQAAVSATELLTRAKAPAIPCFSC